MPGKMEIPQIVRDRSSEQDNSSRSNGQYVQDLKQDTTVFPPTKPFHQQKKPEDNNKIDNQKKKSALNLKENATLKGKEKSSEVESKKDKVEKAKKVEEANLFKMETIFSIEQLTEQGPDIKAQELNMQYQLATRKFLKIKDALSEKQKTTIEQRLLLLQKKIYELLKKDASGAVNRGQKLNPDLLLDEDDMSSILGSIPFLGSLKQNEENEEANKSTSFFGILGAKDEDDDKDDQVQDSKHNSEDPENEK